MSDPSMITAIKQAVTIPVMAKARIGHFVEAQILEALGVDYVDESEVRALCIVLSLAFITSFSERRARPEVFPPRQQPPWIRLIETTVAAIFFVCLIYRLLPRMSRNVCSSLLLTSAGSSVAHLHCESRRGKCESQIAQAFRTRQDDVWYIFSACVQRTISACVRNVSRCFSRRALW
jgi:hypothetical protein